MDDRYEFTMYFAGIDPDTGKEIKEEYAVRLTHRAMHIITLKAEDLARQDMGKVVPVPADLFSGPTTETIKPETNTIGFRWFGTNREFALSLASQAEILDLMNHHTATEDEREAEADEAR